MNTTVTTTEARAPGHPDTGVCQGNQGTASVCQLGKDTTAARSASVKAKRARSEALLMVATGQVTAFDVVVSAMGPEGGPLRRIKLNQLVLAQPNVGRVRADAFLSAVAVRLDSAPNDLGDKDILWLTVPRAGAKRLYAWMDAAKPHTVPWPGFPSAPRPATATTQKGR